VTEVGAAEPAVRAAEPTIRSVARRAGVSKSLVSLVLRDSPHVSDARRRAVLDAIRDLGYRPNAAARSLTERRTRAVGVVLNDLRNPWYVDCLDGLNAVLHAGGMTMLLGDGRLDRHADDRLLHTFMDMRVDGLVLVGSMPPSPTVTEAARRLPTVVAGSRDFALPHVDVSAQDDRLGAELATEHLLALGHRRVAHVAGDFLAVSQLRRRSYEDTMRRHGLAEEIRIEMCDLTEEGGHAAGLRLLAGPRRPTAVFGVTDIACVGVLAAAAELRLEVPGDLSVIGYDNTYLARLRHLSLTSVDISSQEVGSHAARLLLARIDDPTAPGVEHLVTPSVVGRGSSAPPGGRPLLPPRR
jgi:DNA-binding LacI/PurR family transcriptional regulator